VVPCIVLHARLPIKRLAAHLYTRRPITFEEIDYGILLELRLSCRTRLDFFIFVVPTIVQLPRLLTPAVRHHRRRE